MQIFGRVCTYLANLGLQLKKKKKNKRKEKKKEVRQQQNDKRKGQKHKQILNERTEEKKNDSLPGGHYRK